MISGIINEAINLAKDLHKDQIRKNGEPYINHCLNVMNILQKYDFDERVLIAAILHDVCEDSKICNTEISKKFGTRIGFIVNALSKNKKPQIGEDLEKQYRERKIDKSLEEYFDSRFLMYISRLYMGIMADSYIMFIKMADQIDNLATIEVFSKEKQLRKIEEIKNYFLPMYEKAAKAVLTPKNLKPIYLDKYILLKNELVNLLNKKKNHFYLSWTQNE